MTNFFCIFCDRPRAGRPRSQRLRNVCLLFYDLLDALSLLDDGETFGRGFASADVVLLDGSVGVISADFSNARRSKGKDESGANL